MICSKCSCRYICRWDRKCEQSQYWGERWKWVIKCASKR